MLQYCCNAFTILRHMDRYLALQICTGCRPLGAAPLDHNAHHHSTTIYSASSSQGWAANPTYILRALVPVPPTRFSIVKQLYSIQIRLQLTPNDSCARRPHRTCICCPILFRLFPLLLLFIPTFTLCSIYSFNTTWFLICRCAALPTNSRLRCTSSHCLRVSALYPES
jgi:hypothetical protein